MAVTLDILRNHIISVKYKRPFSFPKKNIKKYRLSIYLMGDSVYKLDDEELWFPTGVELVLPPPIVPLLDDGGPLDILPSFCINVALSTTPAVEAVDRQVLILLFIISSRSLLGFVNGRLFFP